MTVFARVADLAEQIRGVTYAKEDAELGPRPGYLPILRAGNIADDGLVFDDLVYVPAERIAAAQRVRRNDVVVAASSGSVDVVGKAARAHADFEGGFGAFCRVLRPGPRVDPAYFAHFFRTRQYRQRVSALAAGANINNLRNEHLNDFKIPLPSFPEQRRIAEILDKADALRAKRRAAIAQLDTLTQSIFLDMFGDPATNPKDVRQVALGDIADIATGSTPSREVDGYFGGEIPWVKTTEVRGEVIRETEERLTPSGLRAIRGKLHPINSVVIAMYGQGKTRGQTGLLFIDAAVNQACAVVLPSPSFDPRFMFAQLRLAYERLRALGRGGNQENLNLDLVRSFRVLLPPMTQQAAFVARVGAIGRVKVSAGSSLSELDDLFASIQHRAFREEL